MISQAAFAQLMQQIALPAAAEEYDRFARYCAELQEWNCRMNLTAITDDEGVAEKHFADSLLPLTMAELPQGAALVRTALHVGKGRCTSGPGVAGPSAAFVGLQAGGGGVGPAGVQLAAGTPHHVHEGGLGPGRMLRCGHCSLTPDGRPQGRSPCPWR